MKSSTLMVILLVVVQAVLIMGVFAAAVSIEIENSAVAAGEEKKVSPPCPKKGNPGFSAEPPVSCNHCNDTTGKLKCEDEVASNYESCAKNAPWCHEFKQVEAYPNDYFICYDDFKGKCCNKKN